MTAPPGRRRALGALCALALAPAGPGCRSEPQGEAVRVPLEQLAGGRRVTVKWRGEPVELRQTPAGPVARSLVCTHFGCPTRWDDERGRYVCPCHAGQFDEQGQPVAGPPNRPLATLPLRVVGREVVLGPP